MRTCVRVEPVSPAPSGHDPARRPRRVLRVGRAARRPAVAGAAGDRGRRRGAGGELRGEGVRRPNRDGRSAGEGAVPARDRGEPPHVGVRRGEPGRLRGVCRHDAARRGTLDRRGVPRRRRATTTFRHADRDRGAVAALGDGARRSADHGRRRAHQVPRQGRERGRKARRSPPRAARARARLPAPATGRTVVGGRADHRGEARGTRHPHRRRGRAAR